MNMIHIASHSNYETHKQLQRSSYCAMLVFYHVHRHYVANVNADHDTNSYFLHCCYYASIHSL